jgi:hypothetical protein
LLLLGGGLLLDGGVPEVDGGVDGVFGFVDGVDCVGQFALASITDPSGHVFVVGDVVVGGVNVWVHNGSFGVFVQSSCGGVPVVQLFTHVGPLPFPPDAGTVELVILLIRARFGLTAPSHPNFVFPHTDINPV